MKKYLLIIIAFLASFSFASAQNGRSEKVQALKVAFITQKLNLTSAEAEKFWPVYNNYENEIKSVRTSNRDGDVIDNEQKVLDIRKKYRPEHKCHHPQQAYRLARGEGPNTGPSRNHY